MFKSKNLDGTLNICGKKIELLRKSKNLSQRALADELQLMGIDLGKNAIQQIESGGHFVIDIELRAFASYFSIPSDELILG